MLAGGMRLPPNVLPFIGAARLTARGAHPILEAPDDHTLVQYAGLKGIPGSGPGVSGYAEEDVLALLSNCVRPGGGAVDATGDQPGVFTHSLDADFLETLWRRLCADGFDISTPAPNVGEALRAIRGFVEIHGVAHAEYCPNPGHWVPLGDAIGAHGGAANAGRGRNHCLYQMFWENFAEADGSARGVSMIMTYTHGWWTGAMRQDPNGPVVTALDAMWAEVVDSGTAMMANRVQLARATAIHKWLDDTKFPGSLYEFTVARGGDPDTQRLSELELRALLGSSRADSVRRGLGQLADELLMESPILKKVFVGPRPVWGTFLSLLDKLVDGFQGGNGARGAVASYQDVLSVAAWLEEYEPVMDHLAERYAALLPARQVQPQDVIEAVLAERLGTERGRRDAPKPDAGGRQATVDGEDLTSRVLDMSQVAHFRARMRTKDGITFVETLQRLAERVPQGEVTQPLGAPTIARAAQQANALLILEHLFTSDVLGVLQFATGKVKTLPLDVFSLPAVSSAPKFLGEYLAAKVLTDELGRAAPEQGVKLVLPDAMVKAVALRDWAKVDFEALCLLVHAALLPIFYKCGIPKGEEWTSIQRADDLLRYGSRLVAAVNAGTGTDANSFATLVAEWKSFIQAGESLGVGAGSDQIVNARKFMNDSLALAARHGVITMNDINPLGQVPLHFVPPNAAPFQNLDRHREAQESLIKLASSFPVVSSKLGFGGGLTPTGVARSSGGGGASGGGGSGGGGGDATYHVQDAHPVSPPQSERAAHWLTQPDLPRRCVCDFPADDTGFTHAVPSVGEGDSGNVARWISDLTKPSAETP